MSKDVELKATIQLPRTSFKMKANLPQKEPTILDWWDRIDVYGSIREAAAGAEPFVLHDGPPYANARIHLGQSLNKILKDFVVKSRSMMGHDARYIPGWDCHGLPIEVHIDRELGAKKAELNALQVRGMCRKHAEKYVKIQADDFRRLGVFWDRATDAREAAAGAPGRSAIYRTIDPGYEAEIVRQLGRFFSTGGVYHGVKPVHWCWSCKTALAEAEVEYADRTDPSIYVRFPVRGLERRIGALAGRDVAVVIWTTTPWTLPANMAVALHPDLDYVAVDVDGELRIVAEGLLDGLRETLSWGDAPVRARFTGRELVGEGDAWIGREAPVERPYPAADGPAAEPGVLILGEHVTLDAGTGCVHTAPGHGADDFNVGRKYGLEVFNPVDDDGRFRHGKVATDWLAGEFVLDANPKIVDDLRDRGWLLRDADYLHSYPHCWRCKNPVLFRSTPQWFIAMDANDLRSKAMKAIGEARWLPGLGEERISKMIETRPDWCISRQRTWGVPIPAIVCAECFEEDDSAFVRDAALFEHLAALFESEGSNAWFGKPDGRGGHRPYDSDAERMARLLPVGVGCPCCGRSETLRVEEHIVDVWFESGVSHAAVLGREPGSPWPADVYLEGHDQYRGWFHSSLLVAVNDRSRAPYREVVVHGFTLDAEGRKMSKSLGNVIAPQDVTGKRGAEILRMWVSMIDFFEDMRLSDETLDRNAESYRKIRNTFRYLLGNLDGFDPASDPIPYAELLEIDRWALQRFEALRRKLIEAYRAHQYHVVYHGLHNFCSVTLSSLYLDILKDRLYTYPRRHPGRRSAQTVLYRLADGLCRLMAPVMCFTAEEIWQELEALHAREKWQASSVHAQRFPAAGFDVDEDLLARYERLMTLREGVTQALELARAAGDIGSGLEAHVTIGTPDEETRTFLESFGDGLRFLFITSGVTLGDPGDGAHRPEDLPGLAVAVRRATGEKCERCWSYTEDVGVDGDWPTICARCSRHVRELLDAETA